MTAPTMDGPTPTPALDRIALRSSGAWSVQWTGVTSTRTIDPWLSLAVDRTRRYADLGENWDGYNSPSIDPAVIETAVSLLVRLGGARTDLRDARTDLPAAEIAPVSGGGLHIQLQAPPNALEIEILPDSSIGVLLSTDDEDFEVETRAESLNVIIVLKWLLGEPV